MPEEAPKATPAPDRTDQMSFLEHLEELRWRIIKALIGIVVGVIISFIFKDFIVDTVLLGPTRSDFFIYELLRVDAVDLTLQSRKLPGQFFTFIGVLFVTGFIIGSPIFIYQVWSFIAPALEQKEKRSTFLSTFFITFFFLMGVSFGYFILVPFALQFFTQFTISDMVRNDFDINQYFSNLAVWVLSCGFVFQVPVISYALSRIGLLTPVFLRTYRRHSIVACLILAAFLTPPDPVSQILIALPLTILYEFSIRVSALANKHREQALEKAFKESE